MKKTTPILLCTIAVIAVAFFAYVQLRSPESDQAQLDAPEVDSSVATSVAVAEVVIADLPEPEQQTPTETPKVSPVIATDKPDFSSFIDVKEKKKAFFDYLLPMVRRSNDSILQTRGRLEDIAQSIDSLDQSETHFLNELAAEYDIKEEALSAQEKLDILLRRVDMVPASLALAQAAKESGWGTSRFATEANNYFGQWCYTRGCGLVPSQRTDNAVHEVRKFSGAPAAIASYFKNLNTHRAYHDLRLIREQLRAEGDITGVGLAEGLSKYSERGQVYVGEIQSLINYNKLNGLDRSLSE